MRRKIIWGMAAALGIALTALIWRLDIPHWQRLDISKIHEMAGVTEVFDANGQRAGTLQGRENRKWIPLEQVPENVQNAFIAAEDQRFYTHPGVDIKRIFGALWNDVRTLSFAQGGSTITQQLIKLTHLSSVKSLSRKAQEIALALQLERVMDKRQILEAYLNTVYFGHGAYGIEAAANVYFDKPASALSLAEGALLAGVIKAPSTYAPHLNAQKSVARRNNILSAMAKQGYITAEAEQSARAEGLQLAQAAPEERQYAWYMDAVLTEAVSALNVSADDIISGGYVIETGLNPAMQSSAEALFSDANAFPASAADDTPVQASLVALDAGSGEIRAVIGGRSYDVALGLNRATQIKRQPGSAFKPVSTYAAAIDAYGFVPSSTIEDTPRTFEGGYAPRNAGGNTYGKVTLREALSRSLNIATVDLADLIGTQALRDYAARFGIALSPRDVNLSLALGSLTDGVSPAGLGAAYCALANGGTRVTPHFIRRILDHSGATLYQASSAQPRAVADSTAYMLTDMLKTAAKSGSAKALSKCGFPIAGKTGTVSEAAYAGTRDIWTVAYTPELVTAAWMGFDVPDAEHTLSPNEGGSGYPARLCAAFYKSISSELSRQDFRRPDTVRVALIDSMALEQSHTALLTTDRTPKAYTLQELFLPSTMPTTLSENWNAPRAVSDLRLLSTAGETPVLAFTAQESTAEYALLRTVNGAAEEIAALKGATGHEVRYADTEHDLSQPADYTLLPRHAALYADGTLLTGPPSATIHYAPGGLLNALMGVDHTPTPPPVEIELEDSGSLFG